MYVCLIGKPALERRDHFRLPGPRRTLDDRDVWCVHRDEQCLLLPLRRTPFAELSENVPGHLGIPLSAQDVRIVALKEQPELHHGRVAIDDALSCALSTLEPNAITAEAQMQNSLDGGLSRLRGVILWQ